MAENASYPDKTINYTVYDDGERLLGTATVEYRKLLIWQIHCQERELPEKLKLRH